MHVERNTDEVSGCPFSFLPLVGKKGCAVDFLKNKARWKEPEVVDKVALVKSFRVIAMKM